MVGPVQMMAPRFTKGTRTARSEQSLKIPGRIVSKQTPRELFGKVTTGPNLSAS